MIIGHLLLGQGAANERKKRVARRFIERELPVLRMNCEQIHAGDTSPMDEYALLAGPVPAARLSRLCGHACISSRLHALDGFASGVSPRLCNYRSDCALTTERIRMGMFSGKIGLVMGVANDRSIAWAMSEALYAEGAELAFTHLPSPSSERRVRELVEPHGPKLVVPCDVQKDEDIAAGVRGGPRRPTAGSIS